MDSSKQTIPESEIREFEIKLLSGELFSLLKNENINSLKKIVFSTFEDDEKIGYDFFLNEKFTNQFLSSFDNSSKLEKKLLFLEKSLKEKLKFSNSYALEFNILLLGVSALQKFIQYNWIGPYDNSQNVLASFFHLTTENKKELQNLVSFDEELVYENIKELELLIFSNLIFTCLLESKCFTCLWWKFRCLIIHQNILQNKSISLYKDIRQCATKLLSQDWIKENKTNEIELNIEIGLMNLYYHEVTEAKKVFQKAQDLNGLEFELSGAIGKRTQYQQKPVAQLLVKLQREMQDSKENNEPKFSNEDLPCDLLLKDDVLLNRIEFLDISNNTVQDLTPEEQLVILAKCCLTLKSQAADELRNEKILAYIDCLLEQKTVWGVHFKSLFMRCRLEKSRSRKIERAMMQLEELLNAIKKPNPNVYVRQRLFFSVLFPPIWTLQQELGDLLLTLGAVKSALEVYQMLGWWEGIVKCYYLLGRHDDVAKIVREKLAENETPTLWCLLGDVTDDIDCYFKAWKLSGEKSSQSQARLGYYYYKKKDYSTCVDYFEKSVELNHLQLNVWFSLGYAATQIENYELAARAYRQVTLLDSDNFEAWNNMANAYIRLKQKDRAYFAFQEATKCNYEDWRVWENFLLVCIDVGAFKEAIHSCHRILDIKKKFDDAEVLGILAKAIINDLADNTQQNSSRLRKQLLQLFGRVTSIIINDGDIWSSYASLQLSDPACRTSVESMAVVVKYLQKSLTYTLQKPHSLADIISCKLVLSRASDLAEAYEVYCELLEGQIKIQTLAQASLTLGNVVVRIEKQVRDFSSDAAKEIEVNLQTLKDKINNMKKD